MDLFLTDTQWRALKTIQNNTLPFEVTNVSDKWGDNENTGQRT